MNVLLGASLKFLWGMINTLQFIVFFTEWKVRIPGNATIAIKTFRKIALGEFIESEWITDPIKDMTMSEDEEGNQSVLANMGVNLVFGVILLALIVLVVVLVRTSKPGSCINNLFVKVKSKLFWNSVIRFILQSYLKTSIGCMMAVSAVSFGASAATVSSILAILFAVVLAVIPVYFLWFLHKRRKTLQQDDVKQRFESLYQGIRT